MGIDIVIPPSAPSNCIPSNKKANTINDVITKNVTLDMSFLSFMRDLDVQVEIDDQVHGYVHTVFEEIDLGYTNGKQKRVLEINAQHIKNVLCFVQRFWKKMVDFPVIPDSEVGANKSKLLKYLAETNVQMRTSKYKRSAFDELFHIFCIT